MARRSRVLIIFSFAFLCLGCLFVCRVILAQICSVISLQSGYACHAITAYIMATRYCDEILNYQERSRNTAELVCSSCHCESSMRNSTCCKALATVGSVSRKYNHRPTITNPLGSGLSHILLRTRRRENKHRRVFCCRQV